MKIAVIGTGYVGLVAGACFADAGTRVTCVDVDREKLAELEQGRVPFFEPGLEELLARNWPARLGFSSDIGASIVDSSAVFVAVGTPPNEDGSADLSHVLAVAREVAERAENPTVLVLKSTVPVGTNDRVCEVIAKHARHHLPVVSNPEFLKEGDAVGDFLKPDRVVIGTEDDEAFEVLSRLYAPFTRQRNRIQRMSPRSAEIVKYAANAMLATKISFMNEIAHLCAAAGGDIEQVRVALGSDPRIGYPFLYAGLGFGGSCFPKDLRALVRTAKEVGVPLSVAAAAIEANQRPVGRLAEDLERDLGGVGGKTIAIWGLAFKPRTDDVREAPALGLIARLVARGATVRATDPQAIQTAARELARRGVVGVELVEDEYEACRGADALVVATEWNEYRSPDFDRIRELMRGRHVFDGRNALVPTLVADAGFRYRGVGRPVVDARARGKPSTAAT